MAVLASWGVLVCANALAAHAPTVAARAPLLCVTSASSLEGMAFVRHALKQPGEFRVRALCRNMESLRARELAALGAEVVRADNHDEDRLAAAFEGASGIYASTCHLRLAFPPGWHTLSLLFFLLSC